MRLLRPRSLVVSLGLALGLVAPAAAEDPPASPEGDTEVPTEPEPEQEAAPLDAVIKEGIEKGVAFLRTQQLPSGSWGNLDSKAPTYAAGGTPHLHPLGATSMALYALLKCDVPVSDPTVAKGLAWLKRTAVQENFSAYEVAAALLAVTATADPFKKTKDAAAAGEKVRLAPEWKPLAQSLQKALIARRNPRGWRYSKLSADPGGTEDVSATMFAMLALTAADRCGIRLDPNIVVGAASYVLTLQEKEGPEVPRAVRPRKPAGAKPSPSGGRYAGPGSDSPPMDRARGFHYSIHPTTKDHDTIVTGSRTASGIGVLTLARYFLAETKVAAGKATVPLAALERGIFDGLAWLSTHFDAWQNPGAPGNRMINYLYCTERAMDLVGADRLGEHLWYVEMVQQLLPQQDARGAWDTKDMQLGERGAVIDTAYALLFLRRAAQGGVPRMPVVTGGDE